MPSPLRLREPNATARASTLVVVGGGGGGVRDVDEGAFGMSDDAVEFELADAIPNNDDATAPRHPDSGETAAEVEVKVGRSKDDLASLTTAQAAEMVDFSDP